MNLIITKDQLIEEIKHWNFLEDDPEILVDLLFEKYGIDMEEEERKFLMGFAYEPKKTLIDNGDGTESCDCGCGSTYLKEIE